MKNKGRFIKTKLFKIRAYAIAVFLFFGITLFPAVSFSGDLPSGGHGKIMRLSLLIKKALKNPGISSSALKAEALSKEITIAKALPEPVADVGFTDANGFNNPEIGANAMSNIGFSLSQKIPFPSKLGTKSMINKYSYLSLAERTEDIKTVTTYMVKKAYYELALIEEQIKIIKYNRLLIKLIIKDAKSRYEVGTAPAPAYIRAMLEDASLVSELITLQGEKSDLAHLLSELTGIKRDILEKEKAVMPQVEATYKPAAAASAPSFEIEKAYKYNPGLKSLEFASKKSSYDVEYAKEQYLPDIYLKLGYGDRYSMEPVLSVSVGISLPIYFNNYQEPLIEKARKERLASLYDISWKKLQIRKEAMDASRNIKTDRDNYRLYKNLYIPEARLLFKSEMASFGTGRTSAFSLLDSFRKLINSEFKMDGYQAKYFIDKSRLGLIAGSL